MNPSKAFPHKIETELVMLSFLGFLFVASCLIIFDFFQALEQEQRDLEAQREMVEKTMLQSIAEDVWLMDEKGLELRLTALSFLPNVALAEVLGTDGKPISAAGSFPTGISNTYEFQLVHEHRGKNLHLGNLRMVVSVETLRERLFDERKRLLASEVALAFITSLFILLIVHYLIVRHLRVMAGYVKKMKMDDIGPPLRLAKTPSPKGSEDEIDAVCSAINEMRGNLEKDLSARLKAERELSDSEGKYRRLVEATREDFFIYTHDREGVITYMSPSVALVLGYTPTEVLGPFDAKYTDNPINREAREKTVFLLEGKGAVQYEIETRHKDGSIRRLRVSKTPILDQEGRVVAVEGIAHDVTKERLAEEALREKTKELDNYFNSSPELLCIADTDGYFRKLNPQWEKTLGYPLAELEGKRFLDLVHPNDQEATKEQMSHLSMNHEISNFATRYRCRDGTYRWIAWKSASPSGKEVYALARDVTEQIEADRKLRAYAEHQRMLVREVNHRVKNNLTAIISMLHLEMSRSSAKGTSDIREVMSDVEKRVRSLSTLHSILSASDWRPVQLRELCERICTDCFAANGKMARLNVSGVNVAVDAAQAHHLTLVLNEIATNTAKHADHAGPLTVDIDIGTDGGQVILTCRDNGSGFPVSMLGSEVSFSGIGLELVRGIVLGSLRGRVELSNDGGAVVRILFPIADIEG